MKVSVIIPCFNQGNYLNDCLYSIYNQTYRNWQCIIVNDGSTDNTEKVANVWCNKDSRFVLVNKENGGLSSARNEGIKLAEGDYIQFLDSDDVISELKFERSLDLVGIDDYIVVSNFSLFEDKNKNNFLPPYCHLTQDKLCFDEILNNWDILFTIPIHCGLFPKRIFKDIKFNENLRAKEDWLFWIQISRLGIPFKFLDLNFAFYRQHSANMTADKQIMEYNLKIFFSILKNYISDYEYIKFLEIRISYLYQNNYKLYSKLNYLKNKRIFKYDRIFQNLKTLLIENVRKL
jgi:glycosyltransferase involved in cell wall biosynthesis